MSSIPGIDEHYRELTEEEELLEEERLRQEEEEKRRINEMIEKHYGKDGVQTMAVKTSFFSPKPVILSTEELDDDKIIDALENTPVFKRDEKFNPGDYRPDAKKQGDLFNN